jgi:hypothetical protein
VNLARAHVEEQLHDLPRRVAADDRIVNDDDTLSGDLRQRVVLQFRALLAPNPCSGWMNVRPT